MQLGKVIKRELNCNVKNISVDLSRGEIGSEKSPADNFYCTASLSLDSRSLVLLASSLS